MDMNLLDTQILVDVAMAVDNDRRTTDCDSPLLSVHM